MTRELKLSLIIGFALVVVVAMLFSDYMSKANRSDLDTKLVAQPQLTHPAPQEPVVTLTGRESNEPLSGMPGSMSGAGMPEEVHPGEIAGANPQAMPSAGVGPGGPVEIVQRRESRSGGIEEAVRKLGGSISNGEIHVPAAADTNLPTEPQAKTGKSNVLPPDQAPLNVLPTNERGPAGLSNGITKPGTTKPGTTKPDARVTDPAGANADQAYTVADGDSAYVIAKRFYGNGEQWKKIQAANPGRMGANGEVRVGVSLKIPDAGPTATKATPARTEKPVAEPSRTAPAPAGRTYTVKKGDSLQAIAAKQLKSASRADEIMKLNPDQLNDANVIRVGMVLKLPAK